LPKSGVIYEGRLADDSGVAAATAVVIDQTGATNANPCKQNGIPFINRGTINTFTARNLTVQNLPGRGAGCSSCGHGIWSPESVTASNVTLTDIRVLEATGTGITFGTCFANELDCSARPISNVTMTNIYVDGAIRDQDGGGICIGCMDTFTMNNVEVTDAGPDPFAYADNRDCIQVAGGIHGTMNDIHTHLCGQNGIGFGGHWRKTYDILLDGWEIYDTGDEWMKISGSAGMQGDGTQVGTIVVQNGLGYDGTNGSGAGLDIEGCAIGVKIRNNTLFMDNDALVMKIFGVCKDCEFTNNYLRGNNTSPNRAIMVSRADTLNDGGVDWLWNNNALVQNGTGPLIDEDLGFGTCAVQPCNCNGLCTPPSWCPDPWPAAQTNPDLTDSELSTFQSEGDAGQWFGTESGDTSVWGTECLVVNSAAPSPANLSLQAGDTICRDAGSATYAPALDYFNGVRPFNTVDDIGFMEQGASAGPTTTTTTLAPTTTTTLSTTTTTLPNVAFPLAKGWFPEEASGPHDIGGAEYGSAANLDCATPPCVEDTDIERITHATDCTLLTCSAANAFQRCYEEDQSKVWICKGAAGTWAGPYLPGSHNTLSNVGDGEDLVEALSSANYPVRGIKGLGRITASTNVDNVEITVADPNIEDLPTTEATAGKAPVSDGASGVTMVDIATQAELDALPGADSCVSFWIDSSLEGTDITDELAALVSSANACVSASTGMPEIHLSPGWYLLSDSDDNGVGVALSGTILVCGETGQVPNNTCRIYWDDPDYDGVAAFTFDNSQPGGVSFAAIRGVNFRYGGSEGASGGPGTCSAGTCTGPDASRSCSVDSDCYEEPQIWVKVIGDQADSYFNLEGSQAKGGGYLVWFDQMFANYHDRKIRCDDMREGCIYVRAQSTTNMSTFSIDQFSYDNGNTSGTIRGKAFLTLDNEQNTSYAGIISLTRGRVEINTEMQEPAALIFYKYSEGTCAGGTNVGDPCFVGTQATDCPGSTCTSGAGINPKSFHTHISDVTMDVTALALDASPPEYALFARQRPGNPTTAEVIQVETSSFNQADAGVDGNIFKTAGSVGTDWPTAYQDLPLPVGTSDILELTSGTGNRVILDAGTITNSSVNQNPTAVGELTVRSDWDALRAGDETASYNTYYPTTKVADCDQTSAKGGTYCQETGTGFLWFCNQAFAQTCGVGSGSWEQVGTGATGQTFEVEDGNNAGTFTASADSTFRIADDADINFILTTGTPDVLTANLRDGVVVPVNLSNIADTPNLNDIVQVDPTSTDDFIFTAPSALNVGTATALAGNGGNCAAGTGAGGVTAGGVAEDCTDYIQQSELIDDDTFTTGVTGSVPASAESIKAYVDAATANVAPACDTIYFGEGLDGTDITTALQAEIDNAQTNCVSASDSSTGFPVIKIHPGTYDLSATINLKSADLLGGLSSNKDVRIVWEGTAGGSCTPGTDCAAFHIANTAPGGYSFYRFGGMSLRAGATTPKYWLQSDGADIFLDVDKTHFGQNTDSAIYLPNGITNFHARNVRFDGFGVYAIRTVLPASSNLQGFSLDRWTSDYQVTTLTGRALLYFDLTANPSSAAIVSVSNGRFETNAEMGSSANNAGFIDLNYGAASNSVALNIHLEDVTWDITSTALDSDPPPYYVIARTRTTSTSGERLRIENSSFNNIDGFFGGDFDSTYLAAGASMSGSFVSNFISASDNEDRLGEGPVVPERINDSLFNREVRFDTSRGKLLVGDSNSPTGGLYRRFADAFDSSNCRGETSGKAKGQSLCHDTTLDVYYVCNQSYFESCTTAATWKQLTAPSSGTAPYTCTTSQLGDFYEDTTTGQGTLCWCDGNAWTVVTPLTGTCDGAATLLDDDTMATATATQPASAESIKAYVDAQVVGGGRAVEIEDGENAGTFTASTDATLRLADDGEINFSLAAGTPDVVSATVRDSALGVYRVSGTCDSTNIQAAHDAAEADGGGIVRLPCNTTCSLTATLAWSNSVALQGCRGSATVGSQNSRLNWTGAAGGTILEYDDQTDNYHNAWIKDVLFYGGAGGGGTRADTAIRYRQTTDSGTRLENVQFSAFDGPAVQFENGALNTVFENWRADNVVGYVIDFNLEGRGAGAQLTLRDFTFDTTGSDTANGFLRVDTDGGSCTLATNTQCDDAITRCWDTTTCATNGDCTGAETCIYDRCVTDNITCETNADCSGTDQCGPPSCTADADCAQPNNAINRISIENGYIEANQALDNPEDAYIVLKANPDYSPEMQFLLNFDNFAVAGAGGVGTPAIVEQTNNAADDATIIAGQQIFIPETWPMLAGPPGLSTFPDSGEAYRQWYSYTPDGLAGPDAITEFNGRNIVNTGLMLGFLGAASTSPIACNFRTPGISYIDTDTDELCVCNGTSWLCSYTDDAAIFDITNPAYAGGAACDNSTDDQAAIQAAIDAANAAGGGIVQFPCNATCVSSTLTYKSNVHIKGCGWNSVLKEATDDAVSNYFLTNVTSGTDNFTMSDLKLDGNSSNQASYGDVAAFKVGNLTGDNDDMKISNVWFDDFGYRGIRVVGSSANTNRMIVENSLFTNIGAAKNGGYGLVFNQNCIGCQVKGNHFKTLGNGAGGNDSNCLWIGEDSNFTEVTGNVCEDFNRIGMEFWSTDALQEGLIITDNVVIGDGTNSSMGISVAKTINSTVAHNQIRDVNFTGIENANTKFITNTGNVVDNVATGQCVSIDKSSNSIVTDNVLKNCGDGSGNTDAAIMVYADGTSNNVDDHIIENNQIFLRASTGNIAGVALWCNGGTSNTMERNQIRGNTVIGDGVTTTQDGAFVWMASSGCNSGADMQDNVIENNVFTGVGRGIRWISPLANVKAKGNKYVNLTSVAHSLSSWSYRPLPAYTIEPPVQNMVADGSICTAPAGITVNSGPSMYSVQCDDNASGVFEWSMKLPEEYNPNTPVTVQLSAIQTQAATNTIGFDVSCMCRGDSDAVNSTWGTAQSVDITFTTANDIETAENTTALTCNGTCQPDDTAYFRAVVDATTTTGTVSEVDSSYVVGVAVEFLD